MALNHAIPNLSAVELNVRGLCVGIAALCVAACLVLVTSAFAFNIARTAIGHGAAAAAAAADQVSVTDGLEPGF
jgi:hypothetical protein